MADKEQKFSKAYFQGSRDQHAFLIDDAPDRPREGGYNEAKTIIY